jgi:hypothetical protein
VFKIKSYVLKLLCSLVKLPPPRIKLLLELSSFYIIRRFGKLLLRHTHVENAQCLPIYAFNLYCLVLPPVVLIVQQVIVTKFIHRLQRTSYLAAENVERTVA